MNWNEYFLNIATEVAKKSKDSSTKVGCVIVTNDKRPISFGFNGWIQGCDESQMDQARPMKYYLTCHAEVNAILFAHRSLKDCVLYSTHAPCENCLKYILQSGIREIFYANTDPMVKRGSPEQKAAILKLLASTSVKCSNPITGKTYSEEIQESIVLES